METMYESEHTKFIREFLEKNPQVPEKQLAARAIWWDKKIDITEHKNFKEAGIPQKSYVYFDKL